MQVVKETEQPDGTQVEYTGILFQPVPWSPTTKKGMPQEFEKYHADPDYVMINIPPNFMFKVSLQQHQYCTTCCTHATSFPACSASAVLLVCKEMLYSLPLTHMFPSAENFNI